MKKKSSIEKHVNAILTYNYKNIKIIFLHRFATSAIFNSYMIILLFIHDTCHK